MYVFIYMSLWASLFYFFFFNDTATTEIYTLSLHDALPIFDGELPLVLLPPGLVPEVQRAAVVELPDHPALGEHGRSEEHTSELQSRQYLVCRLLLEKKKKKSDYLTSIRQDMTDNCV